MHSNKTYQIDLKTNLFNKFITTIRLSNNLLTIVITNYKKGKQLVTHTYLELAEKKYDIKCNIIHHEDNHFMEWNQVF